MLKLIPLLTDPERHGGDSADSFDVVVPSLPGYGFSDRPTERGMTNSRAADLWKRPMTEEVGYERFAAHGSKCQPALPYFPKTSSPRRESGGSGSSTCGAGRRCRAVATPQRWKSRSRSPRTSGLLPPLALALRGGSCPDTARTQRGYGESARAIAPPPMRLTPVSKPLIAPGSRNEVSVFLLMATVRMTPRLLDLCSFDRRDMFGAHRSRIVARPQRFRNDGAPAIGLACHPANSQRPSRSINTTVARNCPSMSLPWNSPA
jgi:hypothetical protein